MNREKSGGGGIRTHGDPKASPVFETGARNRKELPKLQLTNDGDGDGDSSGDSYERDADLTRVAEAWPTLPPHVRAAVLALIASAESHCGSTS